MATPTSTATRSAQRIPMTLAMMWREIRMMVEAVNAQAQGAPPGMRSSCNRRDETLPNRPTGQRGGGSQERACWTHSPFKPGCHLTLLEPLPATVIQMLIIKVMPVLIRLKLLRIAFASNIITMGADV